MSTRFDILDAKARRDAHRCDSTCNQPCPTRVKLINEFNSVAGKWGTEPGDDERQREQFNARVATGSATS